ncbi:FAD-dependent oxidoreductase [Candidatus Kaiserbacteria bacterium]|nr:MAG: FAD-dependent oxidoreductase [Candidatus Kaiserbacteria bacterium]
MKKLTAHITHIKDLSKTAKEITLTLPEQIDFIAGQFVNIFMDIDGVSVRRAYSISSSDDYQSHISLSIRETLNGVISPLFWKTDLTGTTLELMGPLGLNTADKMKSPRAYLFAYGVGAGVVKSVLDHVIKKGIAEKIVVMTGSRSEDEILHRDYFDSMAQEHPIIEVRHVISKPATAGFREGYIQDHIDGIDFNNADVYACGQGVACDSLVEKIKAQNPENCHFFIEAFH